MLSHCTFGKSSIRAFSLTWSAPMQMYHGKKDVFTKGNDSNHTGLVCDTNMAVVSLFWDTNMTEVTSCENTSVI